MHQTTSVFLSYCWANQKEAEQIFTDLKQIGIYVKKDTNEIKYKDNLKSFMHSIRDTDYALLLISEEYLQSVNCMYELTHLLKEKDFNGKVLPVIIDETALFKPQDRIRHIKFWEEQKAVLSSQLKDVDPLNSLEVYADLKAINEISQSIDSFLNYITSMLVVKHSELRPSNYKALLDAMDFNDVTYLTDLLAIVISKSIDKREILLDEYIIKHPPNSFYHTAKAVTYEKSNKFEQAKLNYLQALKLKPDNYEALNNLGLLYQTVFNDIPKAQKCFEDAIDTEPELTVARLNLGVLRTRFFNDRNGAKLQYDKILSYDPKESRAYNNLGNFYKNHKDSTSDYTTAEYYYKKAIEYNPEYVEAYLNYGNLLKNEGLIEQGNALYKKALDLDKNGNFTPILNVLLNSKKG